MADSKPTQEEIQDSFRTALSDLITIAKNLGSRCNDSIEDMIVVAQQAVDNDAVLRFVMSLTDPKKK